MSSTNKVTERDMQILLDIYENVQLSFEQVHRRHFPGRSRVTVVNRLTRIRGLELIRRIKVGTVIYQLGSVEVGTVYHITGAGLKLLGERFSSNDFPTRPVRIGGKDLVHDLILTEVRAKLELSHPDVVIKHGKNLNLGQISNARIPDLVMIDSRSSAPTAIELELTPKSERRYRHIIFQYRHDRSYEKVLYIVSKESIGDKILTQVAGRKAQLGSAQQPTGKFQVIRLQTVLGTAASYQSQFSKSQPIGESA
jgi:hypothetical protein